MFKGVIQTAANILEKPLKTGQWITDRYEISRFLGRGSYGNSYLVLDHQNQMKVVLKILRFHKKMFKAARAGFEREKEILKMLNHPSFTTFFEEGYYQQTPFFTMEYVNGKTFEQLIFEENQKYSEKEAFQIGRELLKIIERLHQIGIVHRDIRIPNVMLDGKQLRLIDFGLARYFVEKDLPPIQLDFIKKLISPVSDYYALGHFLLFLLYSSYEYNEKQQEKSWEEELKLSPPARKMIRKLLVMDEPFESCEEIDQYILTILTN
jgi:serine/threonine-protein kinase